MQLPLDKNVDRLHVPRMRVYMYMYVPAPHVWLRETTPHAAPLEG